MNRDAINSVIQSIEGQEIQNFGFSARGYFIDRMENEKTLEIVDHTRMECRYVGDGIAHVVSLFFFNGQRRPNRLTVYDINAVVNDVTVTMFDVVANILDIPNEDAMELFAPSNFIWADITPDMQCDVLRHYLHTGEVAWLPPRPMTGLFAHLTAEQQKLALENTVDI